MDCFYFVATLKNMPSVRGLKWTKNENVDERLALGLFQKFSLPSSVCNILASKDGINMLNVESYLNPKIRDLMPDPFLLLDMKIACDFLLNAINHKQKIAVFGDYDVDGATSCAIIKRFFGMIGIDILIYIPDRIKEGYGPNAEAMIKLKNQGVKVVITVDCGTVAFDALEEAHNAGLDVIVIDHHIGVLNKPKSIAVINPNRLDEITDLTYLCGAGVSFMLVVALNSRLKICGYYDKIGRKEPNLVSLLDLVALGTICDVMPLVGLNRAFVKTGLEVLGRFANCGFAALKEVSGIGEIDDITEYTLGFVFGPRINAGGRIGKSDLGARLLSTNKKDEALEIANLLNDLNVKRKEMEAFAIEDAISKVECDNLHKKPVIFVASKDYHQGLIGLISARIKEKYYKPAVALSILDDGGVKASCRSIYGVDIGAAIHKTLDFGLLSVGGGHAMAGGFSGRFENLVKIEEFMCNLLEKDVQTFCQDRVVFFNDYLISDSISIELYENIAKLGPFGQGSLKPLFVLENCIVLDAKKRGENHIFLLVKSDGCKNAVKGMFFKGLDNKDAVKLFEMSGRDRVSILCELSLNSWMGNKSCELNILDILF